ncbi:MAG: sugar transferase [Actinobacteria bacterium]|nr:sugar transferase [Actinomycetota bacterium]
MPRPGQTLGRRRGWERSYRRRLQLSDAALIAISLLLGISLQALRLQRPPEDPWFALGLAVAWFLLVGAIHSRETVCLGAGTVEYRRVATATGMVFGLAAFVLLLVPLAEHRGTLVIALVVGLLGLLLERWGWRRWLQRKRLEGEFCSRTLVVGNREDVAYVIRSLSLGGEKGFQVMGATLFDDSAQAITVGETRYPAYGTWRTVAEVAQRIGADTIVVASQPESAATFVRELSWEIEGTAAELVLSSQVTDVVGPRLALQQVDGLPLLRIRIPSYEGGHYLLKRGFDLLVSSIGLLILLLMTPVLAVLIKLDSRGPVFFSQERVGRDGHMFRMFKFRTMVVDAEQALAALQEQNEGSGPLFKLRDDPRVTRVGRVLRRISLDEFPQFWNVFIGDMSVVGPRPPLASEVVEYDGAVARRLYVKPGITGPWQVSGRSDLSWNESVRLDLSYVENWSIINDLQIMYRTAKAMLDRRGAY